MSRLSRESFSSPRIWTLIREKTRKEVEMWRLLRWHSKGLQRDHNIEWRGGRSFRPSFDPSREPRKPGGSCGIIWTSVTPYDVQSSRNASTSLRNSAHAEPKISNTGLRNESCDKLRWVPWSVYKSCQKLAHAEPHSPPPRCLSKSEALNVWDDLGVLSLGWKGSPEQKRSRMQYCQRTSVFVVRRFGAPQGEIIRVASMNHVLFDSESPWTSGSEMGNVHELCVVRNGLLWYGFLDDGVDCNNGSGQPMKQKFRTHANFKTVCCPPQWPWMF